MSDLLSSIDSSDKQEVASKIKNDLNDYFKFVALLKTKRSEKSTNLIEEYITKEPNILQRIRFIEELDEEERFSKPLGRELEREEDHKIKQKTTKTPPKLHSSSFIQYFFFTRKIINQFGVRTGLLRGGFLGPRMTGDSEFQYKKNLQDATALLLTATNYLVNYGWKKLNRKSYNIVVAYSRFLKFFIQEGNILSEGNHSQTHKKMESFIEYYLQVTGNRANKQILKEAFYEVILFVPEFKPRFREIISIMEDINNTDSRGVCFFNVIMSISMVKFRRFVKLDNLMDHYNIQPIEDRHYDFSPKILQKIKEQLSSLELKYKKSEKELFYLKHVEPEFHLGNNTEITPLVELFSRIYFFDHPGYPDVLTHLKKENKLEIWNSILNDLTSSFLKFLNGFLTIYEILLKGTFTGQFAHKEIQTLEIFRDYIFANDLEKLNEYKSELLTLRNTGIYLNVDFALYQRYNNTGKTEIEKEEKLCSIFKKLISQFYAIAEKISNFLYNNYTAQNITGPQKLTLAQNQDNPIENIDDEAQLFPFSMYVIKNHPHLVDRVVINAVNEILVFCLNFCYIFKYHPLSQRMLEKQKLLDVTEEYINIQSKIIES